MGIYKKYARLLSLLGLLSIIFGVSYSFFNYTQTYTPNNVSVGKMTFESSETDAINLTNAFPITRTDAINGNSNVGEITISINGETTYAKGIEYLIRFDDVDLHTRYGKNLPLSVIVTPEFENSELGTLSDDYFNLRGNNTSYYKIMNDQYVEEDKYILVGYIRPGEAEIDGKINIKAFIDKDRIAISDTYPNMKYAKHYLVGDLVVNPNITQANIDACVAYFDDYFEQNPDEYEYIQSISESQDEFCQNEGTLWGYKISDFIERNWDISGLLDSGVIIHATEESYISWEDETTPDWVDDRVVFTTEEWNNAHYNSKSFKIKVEANEGIWIDNPYTTNSMVNLYSANVLTAEEKSAITAINFIMESEEMINTHPNLIDFHDPNTEGIIKGWIDNNILYIASPGEIFFPKDCSRFFQGFNNVQEINFHNINTSNVTNMQRMFYECQRVSYLDLSSFDTSNVVNMSLMFYKCVFLFDLNIKSFNTSNVTNMQGMFYHLDNVRSLDVSGFDTRKVYNMKEMFFCCASLESLDVSNFNTSNVTNMVGMFHYCNCLKALNISGFDLSKITSLDSFFASCRNMVLITGLADLDVSHITNMSFIFYYTGPLNYQDISDWDVSHVENFDYAFSDALISDLTVLRNWNMESVTTMGSMFRECARITTLNGLENWDVSNVINFSEGNDTNNNPTEGAFEYMTSLVDASAINDWNIRSDALFNYMFNKTPVHPTFTKYSGTWDSHGSFIPNI